MNKSAATSALLALFVSEGFAIRNDNYAQMMNFAQTNNGTNSGVYATTCGDIDVDERMDDFNSIQLNAHNEYRDLHQSNPLAYDHDLAEYR